MMICLKKKQQDGMIECEKGWPNLSYSATCSKPPDFLVTNESFFSGGGLYSSPSSLSSPSLSASFLIHSVPSSLLKQSSCVVTVGD